MSDEKFNRNGARWRRSFEPFSPPTTSVAPSFSREEIPIQRAILDRLKDILRADGRSPS